MLSKLLERASPRRSPRFGQVDKLRQPSFQQARDADGQKVGERESKSSCPRSLCRRPMGMWAHARYLSPLPGCMPLTSETGTEIRGRIIVTSDLLTTCQELLSSLLRDRDLPSPDAAGNAQGIRVMPCDAL